MSRTEHHNMPARYIRCDGERVNGKLHHVARKHHKIANVRDAVAEQVADMIQHTPIDTPGLKRIAQANNAEWAEIVANWEPTPCPGGCKRERKIQPATPRRRTFQQARTDNSGFREFQRSTNVTDASENTPSIMHMARAREAQLREYRNAYRNAQVVNA